MYRYDEFDAAFVAERVAQFKDQVARRLRGELTEEQFRPLRLQNGVYLQLHAYMLRIAVPYGTLSSQQLRKLGSAHILRLLLHFHEPAWVGADVDVGDGREILPAAIGRERVRGGVEKAP